MYNLQRQIGPRDRSNQIFEFKDTLSWQAGKHYLKFGAEIARRNVTFEQARAPRGSFTFAGTYTGSALADFMLGYVRNARSIRRIPLPISGTTGIPTSFRTISRSTPRLTLNLGLRYDYFQPFKLLASLTILNV